MTKLNLSVAIGDYDRNRPLIDGAVHAGFSEPAKIIVARCSSGGAVEAGYSMGQRMGCGVLVARGAGRMARVRDMRRATPEPPAGPRGQTEFPRFRERTNYAPDESAN